MDVLPVVSRANIQQMQGIVSLADVLAAYGCEEGLSRDRTYGS